MSDKKNVILMAMSMGVDKSRSDLFRLEEDAYPELKVREVLGCVSQLEPITRLLLTNDLQTDTEIIMLCTEKTRFAGDKVDGKISVADFLAERIASSEGATGFESVVYDRGENDEKRYALSETKTERIVHFTDILIKERNPLFGIGRAVDIIRQFFKNDTSEQKEKGQFWIAANGGLRDSYLSISAIISLLKMNDIQPDVILSTEFDKAKTEQIIYDAKPSFRMFQFVTGINEFNRFGSAEFLNDYYRDEAEDGSKDKDPALVAMEKISLANKLCGVDLYEEGLSDLRGYINEHHKKKSRVIQDDLFRIFQDDIKNDYGMLLGKNKPTAVDIVERCARKKMYQQALTFIESKMCNDFFEKHVLYYDETDPKMCKVIRQKKFDLKLQYDKDRHFVFDEYLKNKELKWMEASIRSFISDGSKDQQRKKNRTIETALDFLTNRKAFYSFIQSQNEQEISNSSISCSFIDSEDNSTGIVIKTDVIEDIDKKMVGYLIRLHKVLKELRNEISHGEWIALKKIAEVYSESVNVDADGMSTNHLVIDSILDELIKLYVAMAKEVLGKTYSVPADTLDYSSLTAKWGAKIRE